MSPEESGKSKVISSLWKGGCPRCTQTHIPRKIKHSSHETLECPQNKAPKQKEKIKTDFKKTQKNLSQPRGAAPAFPVPKTKPPLGGQAGHPCPNRRCVCSQEHPSPCHWSISVFPTGTGSRGGCHQGKPQPWLSPHHRDTPAVRFLFPLTFPGSGPRSLAPAPGNAAPAQGMLESQSHSS